MRLFSTTVAMSVLLLSTLAGNSFARPSDQRVKADAKEAGRSVKHAAKKTGSAVKKGTKKAVHVAAKKIRQGAEKV